MKYIFVLALFIGCSSPTETSHPLMVAKYSIYKNGNLIQGETAYLSSSAEYPVVLSFYKFSYPLSKDTLYLTMKPVGTPDVHRGKSDTIAYYKAIETSLGQTDTATRMIVLTDSIRYIFIDGYEELMRF